MWVPIRNYPALTVLGFTALLLTLVLLTWASSRRSGSRGAATGVDTPAA